LNARGISYITRYLIPYWNTVKRAWILEKLCFGFLFQNKIIVFNRSKGIVIILEKLIISVIYDGAILFRVLYTRIIDVWYLHLSLQLSHFNCLNRPGVGVWTGLFKISLAALFLHIIYLINRAFIMFPPNIFCTHRIFYFILNKYCFFLVLNVEICDPFRVSENENRGPHMLVSLQFWKLESLIYICWKFDALITFSTYRAIFVVYQAKYMWIKYIIKFRLHILINIYTK